MPKIVRPEIKTARRKAYAARWAKENRAKQAAYGLKRNGKRRDMMGLLKCSIGCQNPHCGWSQPFHSSDLDFHHVVGTKRGSLAVMLSRPLIVLCEEVRKCVVLCAICHRRAHHKELDLSTVTPRDVVVVGDALRLRG